jgi:flagellar hook-associated protein 2
MAVTSGINSANTGTGLGQGIDVQAMVTASLAGDQANINQLQNSQNALSAQTKALQQITTELSALSSAAFTLRDPLGSLNSFTTSTSNSSVLSAAASAAAQAGTHTITVTSLATTSSYYSDAAAASNTPLATGDTVSISVGGRTAVGISITSSNNTLDGLAASINSTANIGVTASVITDANGARLALVSNTTGAPGNLSVTGTLHLTDVGNTPVNFNSAVVGTNADLRVDGIPISSASNTVSGVINGVTLNLTAPTPVGTPVTLTVSPDTSKASDSINQFVSAYNTVIKDISSQFTVGSDGTGGGPLEADGSVREAQSTLLSAVAASISGNNGIVNLASLGVNLNNDGTLSVNSGALSSALAANFASVQNFFQAPTTGFALNLGTTLTNLTDAGNGALGLDAKGISQSSNDLAGQISDLQAALAVRQENLILVYSRVNATLQELPLLQAQLAQQLATA